MRLLQNYSHSDPRGCQNTQTTRLYFHATAGLARLSEKTEGKQKTLMAPQDNGSSIVIHLRFNTIFTLNVQ